jgi:hypothetical protein
MKYYSEILDEKFDTVKDLEKAEKEFEIKQIELKKKREEELKIIEARKAERAIRAKEVEEAFIEANKMREKATELLNKFLKDYGSYHSTIKYSKPFNWNSWFLDCLNDLFNF